MTVARWARAGMGVLMLSGCANKVATLTPEVQAGMLADLQAGKLSLDCGAGCLLTWMSEASSLHALDLAEKWQDLAVRVMQIGYAQDLAYYYLGQAAQGLNYQQAAIGYYGYALGLATGQNTFARCAGGQSPGNDPCQGVDLVNAIPVLMQASRDALAQQQAAAAAADAPPPPPVHHHRRRAAPPAATPPADAGSGSGMAMPPPPAAGTQ